MPRLKPLYWCVLFALCLGLRAGAADADPETLQARVFKDAGGKTLPYRIFIPQGYDSARKYPLVLFLHGAGERGSDNKAQLVHKSCIVWASPEYQARNPCFVVAPQCPENDKWTRVENWTTPVYDQPAEPTEALRLVMALVPQLQKDWSLDADRLYITGLSMGGYGTWELLNRMPGVFAAGVPVCGGADATKASIIAKTPVWIFHGEKDPVVLPIHSRRMAEELRKLGDAVGYTEFPGVGHNSWDLAYTEPFLPVWLFAQRRK
jgi:predicted peptidase